MGKSLWLLWALLGMLGLVHVMWIVAIVKEDKDWQHFKQEHACKVVSVRNGQLYNTVNSNGSIGVGVTQDETAYLCNDGITYWR